MQEPAPSLIKNAALIEMLKESCLIGLLELLNEILNRAKTIQYSELWTDLSDSLFIP